MMNTLKEFSNLIKYEINEVYNLLVLFSILLIYSDRYIFRQSVTSSKLHKLFTIE